MIVKPDLLTLSRFVTRFCGMAITLVLLTGGGSAIAEDAKPLPAEVSMPLSVEEPKPLPDRFMLRMGGYYAQDANTILRLDANNAPIGTSIDFNKTLGGESETTVVRVDSLYRFNDNHGLGLSWYNLNFKGTRVTERDIEWGDDTYPAGFRIDSEIDFDIYKLNYQYSLFHNEKVELGASFGLHIMGSSVGMAGTSTGGFDQASTEAITAPLPVWGLFADYNFTPKFKAFYSYQIFNINYDNKIKGGGQDFLFGLEYRILRNFSLGAAYNRFSLNLEMKMDNSTLTLDTNWNGGMLYGSFYL